MYFYIFFAIAFSNSLPIINMKLKFKATEHSADAYYITRKLSKGSVKINKEGNPWTIEFVRSEINLMMILIDSPSPGLARIYCYWAWSAGGVHGVQGGTIGSIWSCSIWTADVAVLCGFTIMSGKSSSSIKSSPKLLRCGRALTAALKVFSKN